MSSMARSIGNEFDKWAGKGGYVAQSGFYGRESLPLTSWRWDDNGTLKAMAIATAGTVGFGYISDGNTTNQIEALIWNSTADNTDIIERNWTIPSDYHRSNERAGDRSRIMLRFRIRKLDTSGTATENATLQMKLDVAYHCPTLDLKTGLEIDGDALFTVQTAVVAKTIADQIAQTAAASCFIPAKAAATAPASYRWMEVDITAAFTSAQIAALKAGGTMGLKLYPSAAVGTNLALEVTDIEMVYTYNFQPANIREKALATRG